MAGRIPPACAKAETPPGSAWSALTRRTGIGCFRVAGPECPTLPVLAVGKPPDGLTEVNHPLTGRS